MAEPHTPGVTAPDKDSLRVFIEGWIAPKVSRDYDYVLFVVLPCGTYGAKTLDDLPLFSVPCNCGQSYFIRYIDDDYMADWPTAPVSGKELVLV